MSAILVAAVLLLVALGVSRTLFGELRRDQRDAPARLLAASRALLCAEREPWGEAMLGELETIVGTRSRWSFALGCVRVALAPPIAYPARGRALGWLFVGGLIAIGALTVYGMVRYPLAAGAPPGLWTTMAIAAVTLYAGIAVVAARGTSGRTVHARYRGVAAGLAAGGLWLATSVDGWGTIAVLGAFVAYAAGGVGTVRAGGGLIAGMRAGLWCGAVAGLVVAAGLLAITYADPSILANDAQASGDFQNFLASQHAHHLHQFANRADYLATWIVNDRSAQASTFLLISPFLGLVLSACGAVATLAARAHPAPPVHDPRR